MTVEHVEVIVEEPSMEAALRHLLPGMLLHIPFTIYPHQCKSELLQRLPERLRGYGRWLSDDWRILVILDRDDDDCLQLKSKLEQIAADAHLLTRSVARSSGFSVVNRIAIEELEAWYFGDWQAVRTAYPRVSESISRRARYRNPDAIRGGTWEAFERILQRYGYFKGGLGKIEAARAVGKHMVPERNSSPSFRVLLAALAEMATS